MNRAFPAFSVTRKVRRPGGSGWLARLGFGRVERFAGNWNASPFPINLKGFEPWWSRNRPAWVPVALLCCEVDAAEGPKFAAAILDADPDDETPALIACEWLEERGACGAITFDETDYALRIDPEWRRRSAEGGEGQSASDCEFDPAALVENYFPGGLPEGWEWILHRRSLAWWEFSGPLASWSRAAIAHLCLACGSLKDGRYWGGIRRRPPSINTHRQSNDQSHDARRSDEGVLLDGLSPCPGCGFEAGIPPIDLEVPKATVHR